MNRQMETSTHGAYFVPAVGLEAEIRDVIEQHLDIGVDCPCGQGTAESTVDGVDDAAVAIVELLRSKGFTE